MNVVLRKYSTCVLLLVTIVGQQKKERDKKESGRKKEIKKPQTSDFSMFPTEEGFNASEAEADLFRGQRKKTSTEKRRKCSGRKRKSLLGRKPTYQKIGFVEH